MNPLYELADKLRKWDVLSNIGVTDVVVEPDSNVIALVGPALKLESRLIKPQFIRNVDYYLNTSLARHFGIEMTVERWPGSHRIRGTRPFWFHSETTENEQGEHVEDFITELAGALRDILRDRGVDVGDEDLRVQINPEPGFPFYPGTTTVNYSAKKGKEYAVSMPAYAEKIKNRDDETHWGVNFCKFSPVLCSPGTAIAARLPGGDEFLVTHCTSFANGAKLDEERAQKIAACPGMLFPSLATGLVPAANFGETVLVVRPDIALAGMSPYKERNSAVAFTYDTDSWTDKLGEFLTDGAITAFTELHMDKNWYYSQHLISMGPMVKEEGFGDQPVKVLTSTRALGASLRKKFRLWKRDLTQKKFAEISDRQSGERYAYLETKLNVILGWDCIPLAFCPRGMAAKAEAGLRKYGFTGKVIPVDVPRDVEHYFTSGPIAEQDFSNYKYAWIVRDAILAYAHDHGAIFSVME